MPLSPQSVRTILLAGLLMSIVGRPSGASGQGLRHFREGPEATSELPHPELFFAFNNRGNVHAAKRDYDRTLADYSEALRLNPKYAGAMRNRGIVMRASATTSARSSTIARLLGSIPTIRTR